MTRQIFSSWIPDQPAHLNQGLVQADGCFKIANGFAPIPQFVASAHGMLAAPAIGATAYRVDVNVFVFAGTTSNIYRYQTGGWTSVQSGLSTSQGIGIRFKSYNTLMLATNGIDPIKKFDPASPTTFSNLGGTPPTARYIAVVRGFVVLGYSSNNSVRIAWSDNGAPETWTAGTGEAGFYLMPSGGDVTGVVGGEYGLIFQENRILRMTYTADDTIWQFDEIASDIGCIAPNSIATYGKMTFFLSNRGFMMCDGSTVTPIGAEKIDRTYLSQMSRSYLPNMSAVIDPRNSLYIVMLPSASPPTTAYIYNFNLQEWTTAPITTQLLFSALSQGVTLEDLDAIYTYLDSVPVSLDDPSFRGGYPLLLLFNQSNTLGSLSGTPSRLTITDARSEPFPGMKGRIRSVRLFTDAQVATVTLNLSGVLGGAVTQKSYTIRESSGEYRVRENANYIQTQVQIPAGTNFSYIQGYDIDVVQGGRA